MSPILRFRGQPFRDEDTAGAFLVKALADPALTSLTLVVAWARFGGLRRLKPEVEAFRGRGGCLRVILGIDEGGASYPGLRLAIDLADQPYVFHDRAARTFHPKLFLCEGADKALLLVGSSNVTAGGLFTNYEASLDAEFSLPADEGAEALVGAREYIDKLLADEELCRPLNAHLLERLVANARYGISEGERRHRVPASIAGQAGDELFGESRHDKAPGPGLPKEARGELSELEGPVVLQEPGFLPPPPVETVVVESWTKTLPRSDSQQPVSPKTNPTGNLRLTGGLEKVNWRTWFREELFGSEDWSTRVDSKGNLLEVATVAFNISIEGEPLGLLDLVVDHAPHRESGQANHVTILHWGSLMPALLATDYSNYTLTIERMSDEAYRLDISP